MPSSPIHALATGGRELSERHREVLRQAMRLIAERGYHGASLRELARRVGMRQPSLYHYFSSKNDLVEQIIVTFGVGGAGNLPEELPFPELVEDVPRAITGLVTHLYDHTDWPVFVRFVFNLAFEAPEFAPRLRGMFTDTTEKLIRASVRPYVESGQIGEDECVFLCRLVTNAVGLSYIEERLLFPREEKHPWMEGYVAFVERFTREALAHRRAERGLGPLPEIGENGREERSTPALPPKRDRRTRARVRPEKR